VAHHPAIDKLCVQTEDPYQLPSVPFDAVVDLRADRQLRQWARRGGIKYLGINASFLISFLSEHFGIMNAAANTPIADRFFDAVKPLQVRDDGFGASYILAPDEHIKPADLPHSHSAGYLVLVVADHDYDTPVSETVLMDLCRHVVYPVILVNSRGHNKLADQLSTIDPTKIYNACGKFTLNETADIIQKAKLVVTPETGLMQVAAAFGKKMLVLRSSERPDAYFPPFYGSAANGSETKKYAAWVWPDEAELRSYKKIEGNTTGAAPWLKEALQLVQELINQKQIDQLQ
jgi:ADP-heptose:LPS heptosyltransferase